MSTSANTYISERDFCQRYGVGARTVQRRRSTGEEPPFVRFGPRCIRYRLGDVDNWASSNTFRHRAAELLMAKVLAAGPPVRSPLSGP